MPTATYRFVRGSDTPEGKLAEFFSKNRASTDALNALTQWSTGVSGRNVETIKDEDDELVAELTWSDSDFDAGPSLDDHCEHSGVIRNFIK